MEHAKKGNCWKLLEWEGEESQQNDGNLKNIKTKLRLRNLGA